MSDSLPLRDKLLAWLKKQGYPLEMRVAAQLRSKTQLQVRQGWHYTDPDTAQSREMDIVATQSEVHGFAAVHFVIECKAPNKPWVLFTSKHTMENYNRLLAFGFTSRDARHPLSNALTPLSEGDTRAVKELPWYWDENPVGYSLIQGFEGNEDAPYAATLSAVKAALHCFVTSPEHNSPPRFMVAFPIVVTSSPLFECFLRDDGEMELREIDRGFLFFQQRIGSTPHVQIAIVTEKGLGATHRRMHPRFRYSDDSLQTRSGPCLEGIPSATRAVGLPIASKT
jgi:hypothetical protein